MDIWNFPNRFTTGWKKIMAKIVIRLPEPKREYSEDNQRQINRSLTSLIEQLNSTYQQPNMSNQNLAKMSNQEFENLLNSVDFGKAMDLIDARQKGKDFIDLINAKQRELDALNTSGVVQALDTSGVTKAIERAKEREALDIRKFMPGSIPGSVVRSTTTTDPMDLREQNRLGNYTGDRVVTFDAPYMSTGLKMVPKRTFGDRLSSGINQLKTGFGKVKSDIGNFIGSGGFGGLAARALGGILQAVLPKESPMDKFNKQFSVENLGGDPYGYYSDLRAGNLTGQDPFGVNTVSGFGDYQKHYRDYLNAYNNQTKFKGLYTPKKTSKFARDKADFAETVLGLKKTSPNITGTPLIVCGSVFEQDRGRDDDRGSTGGGGCGGFGAAYFGPGDDEFGSL